MVVKGAIFLVNEADIFFANICSDKYTIHSGYRTGIGSFRSTVGFLHFGDQTVENLTYSLNIKKKSFIYI